MGIASLNVIEEIARFSQFCSRANRKGCDRQRRVATERKEPSGDERDNKTPASADEHYQPGHRVAEEILSEQA